MIKGAPRIIANRESRIRRRDCKKKAPLIAKNVQRTDACWPTERRFRHSVGPTQSGPKPIERGGFSWFLGSASYGLT